VKVLTELIDSVRKAGRMLRWHGLLSAIRARLAKHGGAFAVVTSIAFGPLGAQSVRSADAAVRGRVVDSLGPVSGAEMSLTRRADASGAGPIPRVTKSDDAGNFVFAGVQPGVYKLEARRFGYSRAAVYMILQGGEDTSLTIRVEATPRVLDTMSVVAKRGVEDPYGSLSRLSGFFERRRAGVGRFFTRTEIAAAEPSSLATLLRRVAGAKVTTTPTGGIKVTFAQCAAIVPRSRSAAGVSDPGSPTAVAVYIDDVEKQRFESEVEEVLGSLRLSDIEAIEVYRSPSELPLRAMGNACAAIFIWTRLGVDTSERR